MITIREHFAGMALVGLTVGYCDNGESPQAVAGKAVAIADALIARLNAAPQSALDRFDAAKPAPTVDADGRERG